MTLRGFSSFFQSGAKLWISKIRCATSGTRLLAAKSTLKAPTCESDWRAMLRSDILEPYIDNFAGFDGAGKDVLEIGFGMGADHLR